MELDEFLKNHCDKKLNEVLKGLGRVLERSQMPDMIFTNQVHRLAIRWKGRKFVIHMEWPELLKNKDWLR